MNTFQVGAACIEQSFCQTVDHGSHFLIARKGLVIAKSPLDLCYLLLGEEDISVLVFYEVQQNFGGLALAIVG
jgi:hypothetical protein